MSGGEAHCKCGRDLALMCRECDMDVCDQCLQLPKARARIIELEAALREACDEYEDSSQYKGDFMRAKHRDLETVNRLRAVLTKGDPR